MTEMPNLQPTPSEAEAVLAKDLDMTVEELRRRLKPAPTVGEKVASYLAGAVENTRRTYVTNLERMLRGVGPVCDQTCEPCLERRYLVENRRYVDFVCNCTCSGCMSSRLTIEPHAHLPVGPNVLTQELAAAVAEVARRYAIKTGILDNRARAALGLPSKKADGVGARCSAIEAMSAFYTSVAQLIDYRNGALDVARSRRRSREKRPLQDFELGLLMRLTGTGGTDPTLDVLLADFGLQTGARQFGAIRLTVGMVHRLTQMIEIVDKNSNAVSVPVSAELIERLLAHAISRGGDRCDPSSSAYRPDAPVFHYANRRKLTGRHFDTLARRWQRGLDFAAEEQVGFHHLRHTIAFELERVSPAVKHRYLRHANNSITDIYGQCSVERLAQELGDLFGFCHPLVHGVDTRREDALRQLGLV